MPNNQNADLSPHPHLAADDLMDRVGERCAAATKRYNATVEIHRGRAVVLETALESLRAIEEEAAWATRMLIEIMGQDRKVNGKSRKTLSMRRVAELSGVSLASVHAWVNRPAQVLDDGRRGPGTLPRPGQTAHHFVGGGGHSGKADDLREETEDVV